MKIAMIGQKGIPSRAGGIEIHVEEISTRLVKLGFNVVVYSRKEYCSEICEVYKNVEIVYVKNINTKNLDAITYAFVSTIKALKDGADIFHYHALGPSIFCFIPRLFGRKVVSTVHGLDWKREKWGKFAKIMLKLGEFVGIHFANTTISVGASLLNYYEDKYRKYPIYIPNGVYINKQPMSNLIKDHYGLKGKDYILFLSRIVPEKGLQYLIEAFKGLETDLKLVIAGSSSHSDAYVARIHDMAIDCVNIIFTGFVKGELLEQLFGNAYLYVLPSTIEGLPISLLEAMSYGTCCLTSDIPENMMVLKDYGFTFKNRDADSLRDVLSKLLLSLDNYSQLRTINYIKENYSWDKVTKETGLVYQKLMGN